MTNDFNRIGQIVLALAVGVTDFFDDLQRLGPAERHYAGIAELDRALRGGRVGLFADRHQPVALDQQPAVAGRIGGAETEHGQRRTVFQRRAQTFEGHSRNQRRIAEHDQEVVGAARHCLARRQHRVGGAKPLALDECRGVRAHAFDLFRDTPVVRSDDHGQCGAGSPGSGFEHMRQQRLARHGMQHFWHRGLHARALTGGEHDREAGSASHPVS